MADELQKNCLTSPLSEALAKFIKQEHPDIGPLIVSAIEFTVRESTNHYADVFRSIEPLLKEKTKNFITKVFMFKKRPCRDGAGCALPNCIFVHDAEDSPGKRVSFDLAPSKKPRTGNSEVVFNKVDESKHSIEDIRQ